MPNSPEFVQYALDLLAPLGPVHARPLFGGHGLYLRGSIFGILLGDELFLKTDQGTRARFVDASCRPLCFDGARGEVPTCYYAPPDSAREDPEAFLPWASLATGAGGRAAPLKREKTRRAAARRGKSAGRRPVKRPRTRRPDDDRR